ncbi:MAG: carbon storage regulator [Clostridiales Family XIII bacterium]|jgi:carbon storage regulator|nr:carbon storage regulator [Clostridiales Family XIII bacterium]
MLVISRKAGEKLNVGGSIQFTVLSVNGDKVSIGIEAPRDIPVLRGELADTIESNIRSSEQPIKAEAIHGIAELLKTGAAGGEAGAGTAGEKARHGASPFGMGQAGGRPDKGKNA